jgi:hypothetical protein
MSAAFARAEAPGWRRQEGFGLTGCGLRVSSRVCAGHDRGAGFALLKAQSLPFPLGAFKRRFRPMLLHSRAIKRRIISSLPAFDAMQAARLTMK